MNRKIFLASKSPRRLDLLTEMGYEVVLVDSDYEEDNGRDVDSLELARIHARGKAEATLKNVDKGIVLGADTFVVLDNKVIGKPKSKEDAKDMLKKMSGRTHEVVSGVCVINAETEKIVTEIDVTKVTFIELSDEVLDRYLEVAVYMDKAGAYAIQGEASVFVDKIEGSYSNIMGLPKELTEKILEKFY